MMNNRHDIVFQILSVNVIVAIIYGGLALLALSAPIQRDVGVYPLIFVSFLLGLWIGIILANKKVSFQKALLDGIISGVVILIIASIIVGVGDIIFDTSRDVFALDILTIWLIGGSSFLLWIFLGILIRIL